MISGFRKFFQSKIGLPIFILFLGVVALAFAAGDLTGTTFGGITGSERVALVGDDAITTNELLTTSQTRIRAAQRDNPGLTMENFLEQDGLEQILEQILNRYSIGGYAEKYGIRAGTNLVNSEILKEGVFRGLDGEFDQERYEQFLADQGITDDIVRSDFADGLLAQQILLPALISPQMPRKAVRQYAALLTESRSGKIALIPSSLFAPEEEPDDAAIEAFYSENRERYVQPERRTLRYAVVGPQSLNQEFTVAESEIAERFAANKDQYAASETRDVTLFYVPTEEAANAVADQIREGKALDAAARDAGFNTTKVEGRTQEQFASGASFAVAEAVFAADEGAIAKPAQSSLGWSVARVDKVTSIPARSLAEVRGELEQALQAEKQSAALAQLTSDIDQAVGDVALSEIAEEFNLTLETTPPLLADGRVFGDPTAQPNPALRAILEAAFQFGESQPQLDELIPGQQYLVYEVTEIVESAAPPLAEIRERIVADTKRAIGAKAAEDVARRVLDKARGEAGLIAALGEEEEDLPPADTVALSRREFDQLRQRRSPPAALVLLFSMAEGTVKLLEAPNDQGWILIDLESIEADLPDEGDEGLERTQAQFANALQAEYTVQLNRAMREEIGVERNEDAIQAVQQQLAGEN
ncbi:MAG: SurA N-terminal domain-containing protein [Pseudomonadota bacterium]